ncbi:MAG: hypothetical protein FWH42_01850 [Dehalococcoidia bacterium]|nr:hypothetical protein [Dehalococcoidia bacterium]
MSDLIRSAREIAMAKISEMDEVTPLERLRWKYMPEGESVALKHFRDNVDIATLLEAFPTEALPFVRSGAEKIILDSLQLPINETVSARNKKALEAILLLKQDKDATKSLVAQISQILEHYMDQGATQRKEAYESLKMQYELKLKQAMKRQLGSNAESGELGLSVETLPQFQEEWHRTSIQMDSQYLKLMDDYKNELRKLK